MMFAWGQTRENNVLGVLLGEICIAHRLIHIPNEHYRVEGGIQGELFI